MNKKLRFYQKNNSHKNMHPPSLRKLSLVVIILGAALMPNFASADPAVSAPKNHHSSATAMVRVPHHYEFHDGKYVYYPTYSAEAPVSQNPYSNEHWVSPGYVRHESGSQAAHWSSQ